MHEAETPRADRQNNGGLEGDPGPGAPGSTAVTVGGLAQNARQLEKRIFATAAAYDDTEELIAEIMEVPRRAWSTDARALLDESLNGPQIDYEASAQRLGWSVERQGEWFDSPAPPSTMSRYIDDLVELWRQRQILKAASQIPEMIQRGSKRALAEFDRLAADCMVTGSKGGNLARHYLEIGEQVQGISDGSREADPGFATPWPLVTSYLRFRRTEVTVIGARPSVGKSALTGEILQDQAAHANHVYLESLEMSPELIAVRAATLDTQVTVSEALKSADYARQHVGQIRDGIIQGMPAAQIFHCEHHQAADVHTFCRAVRMHARKHGITIAAIDYLQRLRPAEEQLRMDKRFQVEDQMNAIVELAKELDIHIIVVAQLNRDADRQTGPPNMSHLAEGAAIEAAADNILLLDRIIGNPKLNMHLAKQRNGPAGLVFSGSFRPERMTYSFDQIETDNPNPKRK